MNKKLDEKMLQKSLLLFLNEIDFHSRISVLSKRLNFSSLRCIFLIKEMRQKKMKKFFREIKNLLYRKMKKFLSSEILIIFRDQITFHRQADK